MTMEEKLKAPFDEKDILWRMGRVSKDGNTAEALAYLTARSVMQRLDDVFGFDGWQVQFMEIITGNTLLGVKCTLSCAFTDDKGDRRFILREDVAPVSNFEGLKGAASGALKRAAVMFGIGRYLYDQQVPKVPVKKIGTDKNGKPIYIFAEKPSINKLSYKEEDEQEETTEEKEQQQQPAGDVRLKSGKYQGKTLNEVLAIDPQFISWLSGTTSPLAGLAKQLLEEQPF